MNKEMQLLNDFKLYLQDKSNIAFCTKFYTEKYELFTIDDVVNAIEKIQHQLEEKDKIINKILERLKLLGKYDGETCTRNFKMMSADFNQLIEWLERGKNEK